MGLAAAATATRGQTPRYGLVYDLATGQWQDANQFRDFVRSTLPATQTVAQQQAQTAMSQSLHAEELEKAQNFQEHGMFATRASLGVDKSGVGNQIMTGFKAIKTSFGSLFGAVSRGFNVGGTPSYEQYSAKGGLLTEDEYNQFDDGTKMSLANHAMLHKDISDIAATPGIHQGLEGIAAGYQGLTAAVSVGGTQSIPVIGSWLQIFGHDKVDQSGNPFSGNDWKRAWQEAQGKSLGNAMVNTVLDPFADQETLDRWKRENPWYQMSSTGSEFVGTWYATPEVGALKGLGAAARFSRGEMPLNEAGAYSRGLNQALAREQVTIRNPITKVIVNTQAKRMAEGWQKVEDYALATTAPEFSRTLPMLAPRYRAVDGGAGGFALHWAYNNKAEASALLNNENVRSALQGVADEFNFALPDKLDVADLTQQLMLGDPKAYALLTKLQEITPDELQRIAPGSGTLLSSMDALTTKAKVLQSEVDDLKIEADKIAAGTSGSKALPMFHRWEIHTSLADRTRQLGEVTDALHKYNGYGDWLDLVSGVKADPRVARVAGPPRARWSDVRNRDALGETESHALFMDNQFGHAHSYHKMPKGLFLKRANVAELDMEAGVDSGIMSINRQFDQLNNYFGYTPEGAKDAAVSSYVRAKTSYDRYKIMHDLEEKHVVDAIAGHFGIDPETSRALLHKIHDERNATINGILTGEGQVYRSAPSLASRIGGGTDSSLQLVARNEDTGMVTVNMIKGRHKETFEVSEAALKPRVAPEDITQTPNYYNTLDTRRLFYKVKHDHRLLQEIDAGMVKHKAAALADLGELVGTRFNEFWKPIQLFRLGWPMRVVMDEGARAMAINGPMYWLTGPGAESMYQSGRNTLPIVADWLARKRTGPLGVSMLGPGTVEKIVRQAPDQFARDYEALHAVQLPQSLWDKINPDRLEAIRSHASEYENWKRETARLAAWKAPDRSDGILDHLIASGKPMTTTQRKLYDYATEAHTAEFPNRPDSPIFKAMSSHYERMTDHQALADGPQVFDTVAGREHKSGYIIPLPDTAHAFSRFMPGSKPSITRGEGDALAAWYSDNVELLSRSGMRLVVDPRGHITVGRHFRTNEFTKARQYAEYVAEQHPDVQMWDLGKKKSFRVQDANDLSPIDEATYRHFASEEVLARTPGRAPAPGSPEVYHGTDQTLPENLLPKESAPVWNGRMMGDGLYTTTSVDTAESHGAANLYTVKGSKSGKQYKVWDTDKPVDNAQREHLLQWMETHDRGSLPAREDITAILRAPAHQFYSTHRHPSGEVTWANLFEDASAYSDESTRLLTQYLEENHGVGALTHMGGTTHGHPHQVYVWLHPEDLVVKPLYAGTGEYYSLPQWFSHPQSVENIVPENRIIRKGVRNPMIRELRTVAHKIESGDRSAETLARESSLMDALGLDLRGNAPTSLESLAAATPTEMASRQVNNHLLPKRYVVTDQNHFEKVVGAAHAEDQARALRAQAGGDLRAQEVGAQNTGADLSDFDFEINSASGWLFNKIRERHEMGKSWKTVSTSDGKTFHVEGAFAGHKGELFRGLTSSNGALDVLSEGHGHGTSMFRRQSEGFHVIQPPKFTEDALTKPGSLGHKKAVLYFQQYADTVNDHLGNSPIIQQMIKGRSDHDIVRWLEETPAGQRVAATVKPHDLPTGIWVEDLHGVFDYMVPSRKLQRLLGKGRVQPSDFRKNVADEDLPTIYGPNLAALDRRRSAGEFVSDVADKMWNGLGNIPIDAISRHPFAKAAYDTKIRALYARTDSKWVSGAKQAQYENEARRFALEQTRRHLYNLTETTNFNDALRFIAPFWGAQYEAIQKWMRIISDRPETLARFFSGQRAVYNNFAVVDQDGNPVKRGTRPGGLHGLGLYHPNDRVILPLPKQLRSRFFGTDVIGSVGIPLGSANTVLQGDLPLFPSLGPMVTIPADQFLRHISDTYGVEHDQNLLYRWVFPIGRPRNKSLFYQMMDQVNPAWLKRVAEVGGPENNTARFNMEALIGREMILKARREGKPEPTVGDIKKAADHLYATRIMSSLVMPFQVQYLPQHQYWLDAAHRYQKQYGSAWWDKFVDDYHEEAAIFATSSSNSVGIPPTAKGMSEYGGVKGMLAKLARNSPDGSLPDWAGALVSPQAYMDTFSSDAYGQQFNIDLPGTSTPLRNTTSLVQRLYVDPETRLGWREYRKLNAAIESELYARGLSSIQRKGAEDLQQLKQYQVSQIMQKYPAWARSYQVQSDQIYSDVQDLKGLVYNKIFDKRPDMQGVRQYLVVRQQATDLLDAHGAQGGSRSLQAQENGALRDWFYNSVGQLVLDNPAFAEFYSRYLSSDTLTLGGGGF
jgi:hypothetical protein